MHDLRVSFPKPCSEKWDEMRPDGCNRFCERCDKIIHDLSLMTFDEVEDLARSGDRTCVRARVATEGLVQLKSHRTSRRMIAAIGASAGLLVSGSPASASGSSSLGAIKGEVVDSCGGITVSATAGDGRTYHAKVGPNGRYKVKRLPPGSYTVQAEVGGPEPLKASQVVVEAGRTSTLNLHDPSYLCIVVGMLEIDHHEG